MSLNYLLKSTRQKRVAKGWGRCSCLWVGYRNEWHVDMETLRPCCRGIRAHTVDPDAEKDPERASMLLPEWKAANGKDAWGIPGSWHAITRRMDTLYGVPDGAVR